MDLIVAELIVTDISGWKGQANLVQNCLQCQQGRS